MPDSKRPAGPMLTPRQQMIAPSAPSPVVATPLPSNIAEPPSRTPPKSRAWGISAPLSYRTACKLLAIKQNRPLNDLLAEFIRDGLRKYGEPIPD